MRVPSKAPTGIAPMRTPLAVADCPMARAKSKEMGIIMEFMMKGENQETKKAL